MLFPIHTISFSVFYIQFWLSFSQNPKTLLNFGIPSAIVLKVD
jgi:hypothetical protein